MYVSDSPPGVREQLEEVHIFFNFTYNFKFGGTQKPEGWEPLLYHIIGGEVEAVYKKGFWDKS